MMKGIYLLSTCCLWLLSLHAYAQKRWTLEECIHYALQHNLAIQHKALDAEISGQDWRLAKAERLPQVGGYANMYSNFGHSQDVFGTIQRNDNLNSSMGITVEIMLYNFGALRNKIKKAHVDQKALELERLVLERETTVKVIQAYLDVLLKEALLQARDSAVANAERLRDRALRTTEIGTTAQTDVYEAQATLARERQQLERAKMDVGRSRLQLAQLMLWDDPGSLDIMPIDRTAMAASTEGFVHTDVLASAYSLHPALHRLDTLAHGLALERRVIRAANYPVFSGSTSIGSTYFNPFRLADKTNFLRQTKDNFAQQIAITASIPIFNKGKTKIQLKQLDYAVQQLAVDRENEKQEIRNQIEQLLFDFQSNQQQYKTAKDVMDYAEKAMRLTQKSYEAGRSSIYDYNNSRNQYVQATYDCLQAEYSTLFSHKMLLFQTRGTWEGNREGF